MKSHINPFLFVSAITLAFSVATQAADFTWGGGNGNWSDANWTPGPVSGPTAAADAAIINSGSVSLNVGGMNAGSITLGTGGTFNAYNWNGTNTYTAYNNLQLQGGTIDGIGNYHNWGAGILTNVTVSGSAASTMSASSFFNLNGTGVSSSVFDVADVTGDANTDLNVTARLADISNDFNWITAALVKNGAGTMRLTATNDYTGGTTVNGGTLLLDGGNNGYSRLRGALTVNAGTTVNFANDDGTGFGWNGAAKVTSLTINGGTVSSSGVMHVWNLPGGVNMTGGTLQSNNGTSAAGGPQLEWNLANVTTNASADTATIGGRIRIRGDGGYAGITFNVADGAAVNDLLVSAAITEASGGRSITKTGTGTMVLSGANNYSGTTTVDGGTLVLSGASSGSGTTYVNSGTTLSLTTPVLDDAAPVIVASGATVNLGFSGNDTVGSLDINGSGPLPTGTYNSSHPTYGSYFTGTGSLVIAGSSGVWTSLVDGTWSTAGNWQSGIAAGYDATATFNAATGVTVTLDSNRIIGNLTFDVSDYIIAGSSTLTLDSSGIPAISVATGRSATISAGLAGIYGMEKTGDGTLVLTGTKSYTGTTTVTAGTLELQGATGGNAQIHGSLTVKPGATVAITGGDGSGFGYFNSPVTSISVDGGTINASGSTHLGFGLNASMMIENGATLQGSWQWNGDSMLSFSSYGDTTNTISGNINLRADAGTTHSFYVDDGLAATDLLISGNINQGGTSGLTKNGAGTMVLTGTNSYTGTTTVSGGKLSISSAFLSDTATVSIASGAVLDLNFTGSDTVGSLVINGNVLPTGTYDSSHPTYGSYFTGTGSLVIPGADGTWTSLVDGNWSDAANWLSSTIANGYDHTATFNAATGTIVTVDSNRKIGHLAFDVSDYTIAGTSTLTLEAAASPSISVTTGRSATISANLAGTGGMAKTEPGTLVLAGVKSYTGGTTVIGGTLELAGGNSGNSIIRGALNIGPGTTVALTGGDGSGFGWNNPVTSITIDGGTLNAPGASHLGFGTAATATLTNGGTIAGNWQWNGDGGLTFSSAGDTTNTISGNINLRADDGASHTFNVADGASANDLQINANLSDQWPAVWWVPASGLTKSGTGTLTLNGTNTFDGNTVVNDGPLNVTASGSLHFRPTTNGSNNSVSGAATATLSFLGTVDLDLSAANITIGNVWNLFNLTGFSAATLTPTAVTSTLGSFTEVSSGVWELPVTGAKWVFTEADGNLAHVIAATDYDTWKTANGVTGGENDDDDSDGLTNHEEYAFGLDPTGGSSVNAITVPLDKTTGSFFYTRRLQSLTGLAYSVWYSTDLATWTKDTGAVEGTPAVNGDVETVPVTISGALLTNPKLFLQVRSD